MDKRKFVQVPDEIYKLVVNKQTELKEYMKIKIDIKEIVGMAVMRGLEEISVQDFVDIDKIRLERNKINNKNKSYIERFGFDNVTRDKKGIIIECNSLDPDCGDDTCSDCGIVKK